MDAFKLKISKRLKGDIGEVIFKHYCIKNKFAYIQLNKIYNTFKPSNILVFKYENKPIEVRIPDEAAEEIRRICKPSNNKTHEPTFVFDFLTIGLRRNFEDSAKGYVQKDGELSIKALSWVEVKTGNSPLSSNQLNGKQNTKIGLKVFRIKCDLPDQFEINYEDRPTKE